MGRADVLLRDLEDPGRDSVLLLPGTLREFVAAGCTRLAADEDIAEVVAEHLVRANLSGHESHGVAHLLNYAAQAAEGLLQPAGRPSVVRRGVPAGDNEPVIVDLSTAVVAEGKVRVAGVWLTVIDPGVFGDRDDYAASVQETIAAIRRSTPAGVRVRIPGGPEVTARAANQGGFSLPRSTFSELVALGRRLGVPLEQA